MGFRIPLAMAVLAGGSELGDGLLFAAGLLTPLAAVAMTGVVLITRTVARSHTLHGGTATQGR
jgi:putative oxidoreductase